MSSFFITSTFIFIINTEKRNNYNTELSNHLYNKKHVFIIFWIKKYNNNTLLPLSLPITTGIILTEETENIKIAKIIFEIYNKNYTLLNSESVCYDLKCQKCSSSYYGRFTKYYPGYSLFLNNECQCKISYFLFCDDDICK